MHALRVIHFWSGTTPFFPYSHSPVPPAADELEAGWAPVAAHYCGDVRLVDLGRGVERADVERVEIVVF